MRISLIAFGLILIGGVFLHRFAYAQKKNDLPPAHAEDSVQIDRVFVIGFKKTKEHIIRRELNLKDGQFIGRSELEREIEADKRRLLNTTLFLSVDANIVDLSPEKVDIIYRVAERWYFFPVPIFNLADRNFTEWWVNQNADFSRVDWGLKLRHFNFRGRREVLNVTAQFGYTKLFQIAYSIPYINKNQKLGVGFFGDYATNKNTAYKTLNHRQQFLDSDMVLRDRWRGGITTSYRPNFYSIHSFGLRYSGTTIADTLQFENPNYFSNGSNSQQFFALSYDFRWDFRDVVAYPLKGAYYRLTVEKIGLGIFDDVDIFLVNTRYARYFDLGKKFYFGTSVTAQASTPEQQPYFNYQSVGTGNDFMRGFERNIIEGQYYVFQKNTFKREIFSVEADFSNVLRWKQFNKIPFASYFTVNFDHGYVHNYAGNAENVLLADRYIFGGGVGIDIITFYDFVMRWEYSVNIEGDRALYFNLFAAF